MSITLRCGCTPHKDADLRDIAGCPIYRHRDLNKKLEQITTLMGWMQQIMNDEELIGISEAALLIPAQEEEE